MLHIYRQITALETVSADGDRAKARRDGAVSVRAGLRRAENRRRIFCDAFGFGNCVEAPWQISARAKCGGSKRALDESEAQLLHIYFGHIAVHLLPLIRHWRSRRLFRFMAPTSWSISTSRTIAPPRRRCWRRRGSFSSAPNRSPARSMRLGCPDGENPLASHWNSAGRNLFSSRGPGLTTGRGSFCRPVV